jgi:hypothetical protein
VGQRTEQRRRKARHHTDPNGEQNESRFAGPEQAARQRNDSRRAEKTLNHGGNSFG